MFALWEWKCNTPVELFGVAAAVTGGRTAKLPLRQRQLHRGEAATSQNVLLVEPEND
jgi:hypothetical protein